MNCKRKSKEKVGMQFNNSIKVIIITLSYESYRWRSTLPPPNLPACFSAGHAVSFSAVAGSAAAILKHGGVTFRTEDVF